MHQSNTVYMQFLAYMHPEPAWECPTVPIPFLESPAHTLWHDMPLHRASCNGQCICVMKSLNALVNDSEDCSGETRESDLYSSNCPVTAHCPAMRIYEMMVHSGHKRNSYHAWNPLLLNTISYISTLHGRYSQMQAGLDILHTELEGLTCHLL